MIGNENKLFIYIGSLVFEYRGETSSDYKLENFEVSTPVVRLILSEDFEYQERTVRSLV